MISSEKEVRERLQRTRRKIDRLKRELETAKSQRDQLKAMLALGDFSGFRSRPLPTLGSKLLLALELLASEPEKWWKIEEILDALGEPNEYLAKMRVRKRLYTLRDDYEAVEIRDSTYRISNVAFLTFQRKLAEQEARENRRKKRRVTSA